MQFAYCEVFAQNADVADLLHISVHLKLSPILHLVQTVS